ncbi:MAG: AraC family transcriptional regulator [Peptococcaceae bacterium]|jgi:AraC-like DNA-binding protein|nr:AraC family transcriptional regulator [Peptococcaceae bacterium]
MSIHLNEIMEEYARVPFSLGPARYYRTEPGHNVEGYCTYFSAFLFPLRGKLNLSLSGNSYEIQPGTVIHDCPGKWLTARNEGDIPFELFALYYQYDGTSSGYMHGHYELEIGANPRLFSILRQLAELWDAPDAPVTLQMKTLVYSALSEMFAGAQSIRQTDAHGVVENAKTYIEQHCAEPHTLCELSARYGMRGKYFSDVFKKHTGISPIDYLIACRLEQARKLLESTECSVKEIGKSVGYKDALYFSRQFKRHFGDSPSGCRQQAALDPR